jgi:hypothetical protein
LMIIPGRHELVVDTSPIIIVWVWLMEVLCAADSLRLIAKIGPCTRSIQLALSQELLHHVFPARWHTLPLVSCTHLLTKIVHRMTLLAHPHLGLRMSGVLATAKSSGHDRGGCLRVLVTLGVRHGTFLNELSSLLSFLLKS